MCLFPYEHSLSTYCIQSSCEVDIEIKNQEWSKVIKFDTTQPSAQSMY